MDYERSPGPYTGLKPLPSRSDLFVVELLSIKNVIRGVSKKFGEWYQKTNKTEDTNKSTSLAFKIISILHNTLLATFIKLLETVSKGLFRYRSQNRCHTFLDCRHVRKTCAFLYALQVGKQKEVHPPYSPNLAPVAFSRCGGNPRMCDSGSVIDS
jgi:hypothetical protein